MRLLLALLATGLALAACRPAPAVAPAGAAQPPDAVLQRTTLHTWRGSSATVRADAQTLAWRSAEGTFAATGVVAHLPSGDGEVRVDAPTLSGPVSGEAFEAEGGATVTSARGRAESPAARYQAAEGGRITSDAGVRFEGRGQRLTARAFRFDVADQHATFEGVDTELGRGP